MSTNTKSTNSAGKEKKAPVSQKQTVRDRRQAQQQARQRQQQLLLGGLAVFLLIGVILVVFVSTRPVEAQIPPEALTRFKDFTDKKLMGTTKDGYPFLGAENAPVTIEEIGSFSCIVCQNYHDAVWVNLLDKFKSGQAKYVFLPVTTTGEFKPDVATRGAMCALQQGKFWEFGDILFDWQTRYGAGSNDPKRLNQAAAALGMDTNQFSTCLDNRDIQAFIDKSEAEANKRGMTGTPTIFLDGVQIQPALNNQPVPSLAELRGIIETKAAKAGKS